jgi:hypothetical protein
MLQGKEVGVFWNTYPRSYIFFDQRDEMNAMVQSILAFEKVRKPAQLVLGTG